VRFAELNLARPTYPSTVNGTDAVDVLFCRNVLMYFGEEQARDAALRLQASLAGGGWLVVSPSEASSSAFALLEPVNFESAVVFRKATPARRVDAVPVGPEAPAVTPQWPEPGVRPIEVAKHPQDACGSSAQARQAACALADQGRLGEALAWCERWLAADKLDPWAHYVRGAVLAEQGDAGAARLALQRCIYLRPGFVLAHLALGQVARRLGHTAETQRHLAVAEQLLGAFQPGDAVPDAGGLTAGRLQDAFKATAPTEGAT
jgi:chemotaxis protein methyltransferase CheR